MSPAIANLVRMLASAAVEEEARQASRPRDPAALAAEARRLMAQGLKPADLARAFGPTEAGVRQLLEQPQISP